MFFVVVETLRGLHVEVHAESTIKIYRSFMTTFKTSTVSDAFGLKKKFVSLHISWLATVYTLFACSQNCLKTILGNRCVHAPLKVEEVAVIGIEYLVVHAGAVAASRPVCCWRLVARRYDNDRTAASTDHTCRRCDGEECE